jgi:hypothetical protein
VIRPISVPSDGVVSVGIFAQGQLLSFFYLRLGLHFAPVAITFVPLLSSVFPLPCPSCNQTRGIPSAVSDPTRVVVTVTVQCQSCNHTWYVQTEQPPVVVIDSSVDNLH